MENNQIMFDDLTEEVIKQVKYESEGQFNNVLLQIPFEIEKFTDVSFETCKETIHHKFNMIDYISLVNAMFEEPTTSVRLEKHYQHSEDIPLKVLSQSKIFDDKNRRYKKMDLKNVYNQMMHSTGVALKRIIWDTIDRFPVQRAHTRLFSVGSVLSLEDAYIIYNSWYKAIDEYLSLNGDIHSDCLFMGLDTYRKLNYLFLDNSRKESVLDRLQKRDFHWIKFIPMHSLSQTYKAFLVENSKFKISFSMEVPFTVVEYDHKDKRILESKIATFGTMVKDPRSVLMITPDTKSLARMNQR